MLAHDEYTRPPTPSPSLDDMMTLEAMDAMDVWDTLKAVHDDTMDSPLWPSPGMGCILTQNDALSTFQGSSTCSPLHLPGCILPHHHEPQSPRHCELRANWPGFIPLKPDTDLSQYNARIFVSPTAIDNDISAQNEHGSVQSFANRTRSTNRVFRSHAPSRPPSPVSIKNAPSTLNYTFGSATIKRK